MFCRAKAVELCPHVAGGVRIRVKLMLDARAKMDAWAASALRHKLNALLSAEGGTLRLPEEPGLEYRGARVVDAEPWDELFEAGRAIVAFECEDGAAYGDEHESAATAIDVKGTAETYPVFEMTASEGDSMMMLSLGKQVFVNVIGTFAGGEKAVIDCQGATVFVGRKFGKIGRKSEGEYIPNTFDRGWAKLLQVENVT